MAHINFSKTHDVPAVADAWLPATAAATQYAIRISGREDIAVKLGPGFAKAAGTAMFTPTLATIEVDTDVMLPGIAPEDVNPSDELFRARSPLFIGALVHEAAHSRYSRWVPGDLLFDCPVEFTKRKVDVLVALEESRIEKRMLRRYAGARIALATIVFDLIGKDFRVSEDAYGASIAAALTLARVDAGSLTDSEAKPFREVILSILEDETLDTLRGLWNEYHALEFARWEDLPLAEMDSIATRWIEALGMDASDESGEGMSCEFAFEGSEGEGEGEGSEGEGSGSGGSEGGSGDGEGGSGSEGGEGDLSKKIKDAAADAKHSKDMDAAEKVGKVKAKRRAAQREADKERHAKGKNAAKDAYGTPGNPKDTGRGTGKHGYTNVGRSTVAWRKPTERERAAGVKMSRLLEKVIYSDRRVAKVKQVLPGGRLHGRGQVQRAAQRRAGQHAVSPGWVVKKRTTVDEPKITVGVMLDVSGSMTAQARLAGSLSYALGNAVERVGGEFGMTLFGSDVLGLVKAGQKLDVVPQINASCGWEYFSKALFALDNELDLVDGDGLRVLVLLSDGVFVHADEQRAANAIIPMLASKGVVVLHVDIGGTASEAHYGHYEPLHYNPFPPLVMGHELDPVEGSNMIGQYIIELVKKFKGGAAA